MKTTIASAVALALLVTPAMAQMGGRRHQGEDKPAAKQGAKVDEKAYKAALERIPEPKQKYDPWGGVVAPQPEKGTKRP